MTDDNSQPTSRVGPVHRVLTGGLGVVILGGGVYAMRFVSTSGILQLVGGVALIALGTNMIASALRARESWMDKIGPLP